MFTRLMLHTAVYCAQVLRKQPSLLLESEIFGNTFLCGCAALHIQHREAGRSVIARH